MTATIELNSARRKLCAALGEKQKDYFAHMKSWFRKRISKEEFDVEARKLITDDNGHLHNEFLLAILNKCQTLASFQPSISMTSKVSANAESGGAISGRILNKSEPITKMTCVEPSAILIPRRYEGDDRLKVGPHTRHKYKTSIPCFDHRFQPESIIGAAFDLDDLHASNGNNETTLFESSMLAQKEPTLPDSGLIHGRLLMAAWEEGMEGPGNADEDVVRLIVMAVEQALRNLVTALLMDRNGYRTKLGGPFAIGSPARDPWILNTRKKDTNRKPSTTESLNPEHPVPVPIAKPTQKEAEHAAMMETACGAKSDKNNGPLFPRDPISLFDLMNTMEKVTNIFFEYVVEKNYKAIIAYS